MGFIYFIIGFYLGSFACDYVLRNEYKDLLESHKKSSSVISELSKTIRFYQDYINNYILKK